MEEVQGPYSCATAWPRLLQGCRAQIPFPIRLTLDWLEGLPSWGGHQKEARGLSSCSNPSPAACCCLPGGGCRRRVLGSPPGPVGKGRDWGEGPFWQHPGRNEGVPPMVSAGRLQVRHHQTANVCSVHSHYDTTLSKARYSASASGFLNVCDLVISPQAYSLHYAPKVTQLHAFLSNKYTHFSTIALHPTRKHFTSPSDSFN